MTRLTPSFLRYFIYNNAFMSATDTLATGTLLTAYALALGASPFIIGCLGGLPYMGILANTFGAYLVYKGLNVKKITVGFSFSSRPFYLLCAALALLHGIKYAALWLMLALGLCYLIGGISAGAYYPWLKSLLPEKQTHLFVQRKYTASMAAHIAAFVLAWLLMHYASDAQGNPPLFIYAAIFFISFICGTAGTGVLLHVPAVPLHAQTAVPAKKQIYLLWKQHRLLLSMCALGLGIMLFTHTFIPVFALQIGEISVTLLTALTLLGQIGFLISLPLWKHLNEGSYLFCSAQRSFVLLGVCLLPVAIFLPWMPKAVLPAVVSVLFIVMFIAKAGIQAGLDAAVLLEAPQAMSAAFFTVVSWVKLTAALGPVCAGICWTLLNHFNPSNPTTNWQLFFLICVIFTLGAAGLCTLKYHKF